MLNFREDYKYLFFIFIIPFFIFFLFNFLQYPISRNYFGFLDNWFYQSYAINYDDLYNRYGLTYYSSRFGIIFPLILLNKFFSFTTSFLIFTLLLFYISSFFIFNSLNKYFSKSASLFITVTLCSSNWFLATISWTYPDSVIVPYLIASLSLVISGKRDKKTIILMGLFCSLAFFSNVFSVIPIFCTYLAFIVNKNFSKKELYNFLKITIMTFLCVFIFVCMFYMFLFGEWNILKPSINMVTRSINNLHTDYRVPIDTFLKTGFFYPSFISIVICCLTFFGSKNNTSFSKNNFYSITVYFLVLIALNFMNRFFLKGATFETFYYFSLFIPITFYTMIYILSPLIQKLTFVYYLVIFLFFLFFLVLPYDFLYLTFIDNILIIYLIIFLFIFSYFLLVSYKLSSFLSFLYILFFLIFFQISFTQKLSSLNVGFGNFDLKEEKLEQKNFYYNYPNTYSFDELVIFQNMINEIKNNNLSNNQLFFLSPLSNATNSLRSSYLWGYSSLLGDINNYPYISNNGDLYNKVKSGNKFFLFVFDDDKSRLNKIELNIKENLNGFYEINSYGKFSSKNYLFYYKIFLFN